jgi:hypothetical protein
MIEARCEPASSTLTIPEVIAEIERVWMEDLRYLHYEAHVVTHRGYAAALEFVTLPAAGGYYVTGRIVVDISQIQGPTRWVALEYRLLGSGSSEAEITDGVNSAVLSATFLSHALEDLTRAVNTLLRGEPAARCDWAEEPGQYRWLFVRSGEGLNIRILWFDRTFSNEPDEKGRPVFETECRLLQLAAQLRDQLGSVLDRYGEEGYRREWVNNDFPMREYRYLEERISQAGYV